MAERLFERLTEALLEQLRRGFVHLLDVVRDLALAVVGDPVCLLGHRLHHDVADDAARLLTLLAEHVDETGESITLRTCTHARVGNCSDCEKCYRTILGLLLTGRDPSNFGYRYEAGSLDRIRHRFDRGDIYVSAQKAYHWEVLQETARSRAQDESFAATVACGSVDQREVEHYLDWLERQQFTDYVTSSQRSLRHRSLQRIARNTPTPVYSALYPVYRRVRETQY